MATSVQRLVSNALIALIACAASTAGAQDPKPFSARVLNENGSPAAGAHVVFQAIQWEYGTPAPNLGQRSNMLRADESGRIQFTAPSEAMYAVLAWTDDAFATGHAYLSAHLDHGVTDLILRPAEPLGGLLLDAQGAAVSGASLFPLTHNLHDEGELNAEIAAALGVQTDAEGRFKFQHLTPGAWDLYVHGKGRPRIIAHGLTTGSTENVIHLPAPASLEARIVRRNTGEPVSGVAIAIRQQRLKRDLHQATSDAAGRIAFDALAPGGYELDPVDAIMLPVEEARVFTLAEGETAQLEIPVVPGAVLRGTVYDAATGEGIAGASLEIHGRKIYSDALGYYEFQGLPEGKERLYLHAPDAYRLEPGPPDELHLQAGQETQVDYPLHRGAVLRGRVTLPDGTPVERARVDARFKSESRGAGLIGWSGEDGTFEIPGGLAPATVDIYAQKDNLYSRKLLKLEVTPEGLDGLHLVLDLLADAALTGHANMAGAADGQTARISMTPEDEELPVYFTKTNELGEFTIDNVVPGAYDVSMRRYWDSSKEPCGTTPVVLAATEHREAFQLSCDPLGSGTLHGVVVAAGAAPVEGALVRVSPTPVPPISQRERLALEFGFLPDAFTEESAEPIEPRRPRFELRELLPGIAARTAADGSFRIEGCPEVPLTLWVQHPAYATEALEGVPPGAGRQIISLSGRAQIHAQILDASTGQPVPAFNYQVRVNEEPHFNRDQPHFDEQGRVGLERIDAGHVEVEIEAEGYNPQSEYLTLQPEELVEGMIIQLQRN